MMRTKALGLTLLAATAAYGCRFDGTGTKMQWAPDMADAPTQKSQENYIDPPEGAVAMGATHYPATVEETEAQVTMPADIAGNEQNMAQAKVLFETFCKVCHGPDAKGGGTLGPNFPTPPDLTHAAYKARKDGFFFYRITFGSAVMPGYGHAISIPERWMIIKHLRTLQQ